ncbi:hypothetical protein K3217_31080, partial [bacterium BD-1]|nr:hypothetical protein [Ottowia caeni]
GTAKLQLGNSGFAEGKNAELELSDPRNATFPLGPPSSSLAIAVFAESKNAELELSDPRNATFPLGPPSSSLAIAASPRARMPSWSSAIPETPPSPWDRQAPAWQ